MDRMLVTGPAVGGWLWGQQRDAHFPTVSSCPSCSSCRAVVVLLSW